ncbi:MAG: hypothetical protein WBA28_05075 [Microbacteriaceae bacterium]
MKSSWLQKPFVETLALILVFSILYLGTFLVLSSAAFNLPGLVLFPFTFMLGLVTMPFGAIPFFVYFLIVYYRRSSTQNSLAFIATGIVVLLAASLVAELIYLAIPRHSVFGYGVLESYWWLGATLVCSSVIVRMAFLGCERFRLKRQREQPQGAKLTDLG